MAESSAFERAVVHIEWPSGAEPPVLRCPITGQVVLKGYDPVTGEDAGFEEPDWAAVPTARFCYIPEVGEFSFIAPQLQAAIEAARAALLKKATGRKREEVEDLSDFEILQEHVADLGEVPLVFCLTTRGMACGPVSSSVYVGLDLAAVLPQEEAA